MIFLTAFRIVKFAGQGLWRNFWLTMATITIIALTAILINCLVIVNVVTTKMVESIQSKIDISIFFTPGTTEDEVLEVKNFILSLPEVSNVDYVTAETALKNFRETHQENSYILESLEELPENPLNATLHVKTKSIDDYSKVVDVLKKSKYSDLIVDQNFLNHQKIIDQISGISQRVNQTGIALSLVFIIISALIVFNTIRVAIYTHNREIQIMQLVGGSNYFIIAPFILEGIAFAVIGCGLALLAMWPIINFIQPFLNDVMTGSKIVLRDEFFQESFVFIVMQFIGVSLLNSVGSFLAVRRSL